MSDENLRYFAAVLADTRRISGLADSLHGLKTSTEATAEQIASTITHNVSAFSESRNPAVLEALLEESFQWTDTMVRLLEGKNITVLEFARECGRIRAEQHFPLETMFHSFRIAQRILIAWFRNEAASHQSKVTDFVIEYVHVVSTEFASGYVEQSSRLAEAGGDSRAELLGILLDGYDESDQRVSSILRTNGFLAGHQAFCVGCVEPRDKTEMFNPARANRLLDAIAEGIAIRRRILGIRDNKVVFVASDVRRLSGYSRASEPLFHRVASE